MWKFMLHKMFKMREKLAVDLGKGDTEKPFIEHLEDLRTMIVRMAITLLSVTVFAFFFYEDLFKIILYPLIEAGLAKDLESAKGILINTSVSGPFMIMMNLTLIAGVIVAFPLLVLFLLQFILPGLKENEKKLLWPAIAVGVGLFLSGVCFAYFVVLPRALEFFFSFGQDLGIRPSWTIDEYITFSTRFILVFGIAFELPVLVMILVKLDILNYKLMKGTRAHAIVAIAIFSAVITPTQDALTMALMIAPLYFLYEVCIWLARSMEKKDRAMYPEYYKDLEKDEAAMKAQDDWDNEDYNPWSTADDDDDEGLKKPESKPAADEPKAETDSPSAETKPEADKTLEDYAREDEKRNTD
jgi:sec-independent protein translocase protein TatC